MKLAATHIWIVGASEGIGQALARSLVKNGAIVSISARNASKLEALAAEHDKGIMNPIVADVTNIASILAAYEHIKASTGIPDIVIFNAGMYVPSPSATADLQTALTTIDTNMNGMLRLWDCIRGDMLARKRGRLVVVSSVAAYRGLPNSYAYGASKAGLTNLVESMRMELASCNINIQLVSPGFVDTRLTQQNDFKMPMMITAEKAALYIVEGIIRDDYEIHFPKRFSYLMKLLRILPNGVFFWFAKRGIV